MITLNSTHNVGNHLRLALHSPRVSCSPFQALYHSLYSMVSRSFVGSPTFSFTPVLALYLNFIECYSPPLMSLKISFHNHGLEEIVFYSAFQCSIPVPVIKLFPIQLIMDPKYVSNLNRAGSLGAPVAPRPTTGQQPEYRSAASLNVNTGPTQSLSQQSNVSGQGSLSRQPPQAPRMGNDLEGEFYDFQGESQALLRWSVLPENQNLLIEGSSDYNILSKLQNILFALRDQFMSGAGRVVITGDQKESLNQRMILLESQIEGLMKRKINFTVKDTQGGHRVLDYTNLLNEKQNQIVELEKKINNLEERLRRAGAREQQLENHIQFLTVDLRRKDEIIKAKNDQILAQVAASNQFREALYRLKKNIENNRAQLSGLDRALLEGVTFPDATTLDIKADLLTKEGNVPRGSSYSSGSAGFQYRTQLVSLFREFERLNSAEGITQDDFERILEGFLVGLRGNRLADLVGINLEAKKAMETSAKLRQKLNTAVSIYQSQIERLKRQNPSLRIQVDKNLIDLLENERVSVERIEGGTVFMQRYSEKTIQVPVQDARAKHLLHLFAVELRRLSSKYPKLLSELDQRLTEFFQQELIDIIEVDEIDRIVEIVKYVPQVVKVENVYAYSSEKSRKVQFHLRVLVKALLEQLEKLKKRHGLVLDIDEGVVGMINQEIMGIVDVDDILKVFRVVPKIVEVEKIVQKIVDRVVEVPQVIPIEKVVEKIVEIEKIREVEKIVNIPLEIPTVVNNIVQKIVPVETIIEKVIQVPTMNDRIVQVTREVPKIVQVERIVQKVVEVERVVEVEKQVNHFVPEIKEVRIEVEKIVPVERVVQKIIEVPTFVEKIVQRVVQVPQIIEVEKVVQKIVERVEYRVEKQMIPYVQVEHKIVERIIEKPIPIIQREEKIMQVPQIIEKIVEARTIQQELKEVEVLRDNIIIQQRIKEVIKEVPHVVTVKQEVEKIVQRRVEIPFIVEKIVTVPEIITKPVIQRIQNTIIKQVPVRDPLIVKEHVIVQVEKPVTHYVDVPRVVKHFEEKIVEVPKHIEVIKEVRVNVDKIIEKMVEVPKVVEVEKIVQKIVVVPRVIEKIVEIPQIVEVPVQKVIIQQVIREVEKIVQVPVFQEKIVEVEKQKNVYIEVQRVVDRVVEKIVEVPKYQEKIQTVEIVNERIVEKIVEVPKEIEVQKIVTNIVERQHVVQIERPQVIPVEIRYPVEKIIEKLVPVYETKEIIQQIPQIIQKVVEVKVPSIEIRQIQQIVKEVVVDTRIVEVPSERVVVQDQIKQVQVIVEKPVPIVTTVQEIVTAEKIVEKVIEKITQIPKVYEVERVVQKIVETPQIVEIETLVPHLIKVKEYIQNVVEKIVQVPLIIQRIKQIEKEKERLVEVHTKFTEVKQVDRLVERTVVMEKFKEAVKNINHIEQVLQVVDRYEQQPVEIHTKQERLVEVPHILQKIVEKIVVMPQIVEVLKYVHEVVETESLGVAVGVDVAAHEQKYVLLAKNINVSLDALTKELNLLVKSNPTLRAQIEIILRFLAELHQFILYPKIVQVPTEKIVEKVVEKDRVVRVPMQDQRSLRMQLTLSLLVEKLLLELKRLKTENPGLQLRLDDDINLIFFTELGTGSSLISGDFNSQLKTFSDAIQRKFQRLGSWTSDHQIMLNSFLQERFVMANIVKNCNLQIEKVKDISEKRLEGLRRYKTQRMGFETHTKKLMQILPRLLQLTKNYPETRQLSDQAEAVMRDFNQFFTSSMIVSAEPIRQLQDLNVTDQRISSLLRTKDAEIVRLREQLFGIESSKVTKASDMNQKTIVTLQTQNTNLKNEISQLTTKLSDPRINAGSDIRIQNLNQQVMKLQQERTDLQNELRNLRNQYKTKTQLADAEIEQLKIRLDRANTMSYAEETPSRIKASDIKAYGTPDTGVRRSQQEGTRSMQSSAFNANTPSSSISQPSSQSNTNVNQSQSQTPSSIYNRQSISSTPTPTPGQGTTSSNITANFGTNSGRMTGSEYSGAGSTFASGYGGMAGTGTGSGISGTSRPGSIAGSTDRQSGVSGTYGSTGPGTGFSRPYGQSLGTNYGTTGIGQAYGTGTAQYTPPQYTPQSTTQYAPQGTQGGNTGSIGGRASYNPSSTGSYSQYGPTGSYTGSTGSLNQGSTNPLNPPGTNPNLNPSNPTNPTNPTNPYSSYQPRKP